MPAQIAVTTTRHATDPLPFVRQQRLRRLGTPRPNATWFDGDRSPEARYAHEQDDLHAETALDREPPFGFEDVHAVQAETAASPEWAADTDGPHEPLVQNTRVATIDEANLLDLMQRIQRQDQSALATLYAHISPRVFGLALRVTRRRAMAEEVRESSFFQVWRQAHRFDATKGKVLSWVLTITRSRALDALRRESRLSCDRYATIEHLQDQGESAEDALGAARENSRLRDALMQLRAQSRQLLALAFFRGLSHEEIAEQTALPLGTVKSQIRRALFVLKQLLSNDGACAAALATAPSAASA